jgi:hypothetical protein
MIDTESGTSEKPGHTDRVDVARAVHTGSKIEVYANTLSVVAGEELQLHVSTTARHFNLEFARAGLEETVVWTRNDLRGTLYPTPDEAWKRGCQWPVSVRLAIPATWKSGFYQIKATTADADSPRAECLAFVVVRASQPTARIVLVLATNTYGAYNCYGGANLYIKERTGRPAGLMEWTGEHKVSFQRPWMPGFIWKPPGLRLFERSGWRDDTDFVRWVDKKSGFPTWSFCAGFDRWERTAVNWLEANGYAVDYAVSSDLEFHPELLAGYRLMLSVGHDEYWSWGMRDTVESFVAQGGNVCFFSGNTAFWQVRFEDQGQSMVCYKDEYYDDPYFKAGRRSLTATNWSSHYVARPETRLTGLSMLYGGYARFLGATPQGVGGYLIYRPEHWAFKDTDLTYGDCLGQASTIVNYEVDGCPIQMADGLPYPAADYDGPTSLEILGMLPATLPCAGGLSAVAQDVFGEANPTAIKRVSSAHGHAVMSIYTQCGTVFSAGTTDWVSGLTGKDPAVERVTKNLLDRLQV